MLENEMQGLRVLPDRVASLEANFLLFRTEVRDEFSALRREFREELHGEIGGLAKALRQEMREGDEDFALSPSQSRLSRLSRSLSCSFPKSI